MHGCWRVAGEVEAMEHLLREKRLKISDFAGAWSMSDEEEAETLRSLREGWSRWKPKKVILDSTVIIGLLREKLKLHVLDASEIQKANNV